MPRRTLVPLIGLAAFFIWILLAAPAAWTAEANPEGIEFFEKTIRPLLAANCLSCHNGAKHKGGLVLESEAGLLKGGDTGPAVKPGDPNKSLLVELIRYTGDIKMPPKGKLPDDAVVQLTKWVKIGAPWPADHGNGVGSISAKPFDLKERSKHWSLQPLKTFPAPNVKQADWPHNDLDRFILAKLESSGLKPAQPADKRIWLRRVTFDLIGLPPTPNEIDAFLADDSVQAYEKVVERLLASPHYGERWARHWLDLVRYGESAGHEFDFEMPEAFEYRDYVIRALNDDLPYDRFVVENIAGDLLPKPRRHPKERFNESIIGTGFWFLGESMHSPVEVRKDMADRIDNQIDVFGKTFLGMTMACARCHDHKFDAVPTKDYYAMMGYLESSRYHRAFIDDPKPTRDLIDRIHEVRREHEPIAIAATSRSLLSQIQKGEEPAKADAVIKPLLELAGTNESHFAAKKTELLERWKAEKERAAGFEGQATSFESFTKSGYKDWFVTGEAFGEKPAHFGQIELRPDDLMPVRRVCRDGLAHSGQVSGRLQGALRSKTFRLEKNHILYHLAGQGVRVNLIIDGYQRIQAPIYGGLTFYAQNDRLYWAEQDVSMWKGHNAYIEFLDDGDGYVAVDRIVFADNAVPADPPNPILTKILEDLSVDTPTKLKERIQGLFREIIDQWQSGKLTTLDDRNERIDLLNALLSSEWTKEAAGNSEDQVDRDRLKSSLTRWQDVEKQLPTPRRVMAMTDGTGINERIFIRGNYKSLGEEAPRRFLQVLAGTDQAAPGSGSGRLELARRIVDPSNPLLSRVMVNRIWKHHFGEGIVRTPDDFGVQGQGPTHPELLDYLAGEFIRQGWSIKKMHRMMVLSNTYRMASHASAKDEEADPQNKFLHRMPIRRLEAECIRDAILVVSGRLDLKLYGPSVPSYLTEFMLGRGRPASGPLDGDGRRSLYIKVRRNFLTPMFLAFDYPIPFTTMGRRSVSNVPAQALALMNNPFVIQQAGLWANRILSEKDLTPTQRIIGMYQAAFSREPSQVEIADALGFVDEQAKEYGKKDDPRAWTDLCHVIMNAKEFIFIN